MKGARRRSWQFMGAVRACAAAVGAAVAAAAMSLPSPAAQTSFANPLDRILDTYVRDGRVYYRALRQERGPLDSYIGSLAERSLAGASREEQVAFWLNAYNALVLRTVIDHYPIRGRWPDYPPNSIRQIPGAFDRMAHRVARRSLTLDEIETTVLAGFGDPRVFLALGRGAVGSPRLRSEAFTADRLEEQLAAVARECTADANCIQLDTTDNRIAISPIFSWREQAFVAAYADRADARFAQRSPLERAILAFIEPGLLRTERPFVQGNRFEVQFLPFDWSLNDLTGS